MSDFSFFPCNFETNYYIKHFSSWGPQRFDVSWDAGTGFACSTRVTSVRVKREGAVIWKFKVDKLMIMSVMAVHSVYTNLIYFHYVVTSDRTGKYPFYSDQFLLFSCFNIAESSYWDLKAQVALNAGRACMCWTKSSVAVCMLLTLYIRRTHTSYCSVFIFWLWKCLRLKMVWDPQILSSSNCSTHNRERWQHL
jgi:hypothetical protein